MGKRSTPHEIKCLPINLPISLATLALDQCRMWAEWLAETKSVSQLEGLQERHRANMNLATCRGKESQDRNIKARMSRAYENAQVFYCVASAALNLKTMGKHSEWQRLLPRDVLKAS